MRARFVSVNRDTPMLLPPDLQNRGPEDDLAHFVIEEVDRLRLESIRIMGTRMVAAFMENVSPNSRHGGSPVMPVG